MGRIKRYVTYWTEGIIGFILLFIMILLLAWLWYWVERTPSGQKTGLCCLILFISVAWISSFSENHGIIEPLYDYGDSLIEEE